MEKRKSLFSVVYKGETNNYFTEGKTYEVFEIDSDGDYVVLDDFYNELNVFKSQFKIV